MALQIVQHELYNAPATTYNILYMYMHYYNNKFRSLIGIDNFISFGRDSTYFYVL